MKIQQALHKAAQLELIQAILILSLAITILFWKVIFLGQALLPADIVFLDPAWRDVAPEEYRTAQNPLLEDQIRIFYPSHHLAAEVMQTEHRIPLWNPYILAGHPLVAATQSALFYPPNLLLFWLDPAVVANIRAIFNLLIAGIFTFLLCRRLKISKLGAIIAAVASMLSGPLIVWLGWPHANVLTWFPFLLWAGEGLLSSRRTYLWSLLVSIGIGLGILGGHPETMFHVAVVFTLYFLARLFLIDAQKGHKQRILLAFVLATALGLILSSIQLLPFTDFLLQSSTLPSGGRSHVSSADSLFYSPDWKFSLLQAVTLLCPNLFGSPTSRYWWPFPSPDCRTQRYQNYNEQTTYFGLVALALAVGGLLSSGRKQPATIIAVLALFCLLVAWRLPGFEAVNHLPIFSIVDNGRFKILLACLGSVLAGFGFDELERCIASHGQENRKVCYAAAFVLSLALLLLFALALCKFLFYPLADRLGFRLSSRLRYLLFSIFSFRDAKSIIPAIAALLAIGVCTFAWHARSRQLFGWMLIGIVGLELLVLAWGYNPTVKKEAIFPPTALTDMLQQEGQPCRVMSTTMFRPNFGCVYRIAHIEGYDLPVFQRYTELERIQDGKGPDCAPQWSVHWPLVDWMNVKYIFTVEELPPPRFTLAPISDFILIPSGMRVKVYRNETALPRAYMVYQAEVIPDDQVALRKLTDGTFDFKKRVILSNALPRTETEQIQQASGNQQHSSVQFLTYTTDRAVLHVTTDSPGLLVMSDMYAPGWKARVDDAGAQIIRANYAFRAVFIPEGEHKVIFYYQPLSFQIGKALSILGLLVLIAGGFLSHIRKW